MGILGPFTGKVGDVVGYVWRGRQVVRAYRRHIHYPDTALQQRERQWFVAMVRFAATARGALLLGLRERAAAWQMTEGNAFVKMNKGCFGRTPGPSPIASPLAAFPRKGGLDCAGGVGVDYERIKISDGAAAPVRFTAAAVDDAGVLRVEYEKNSGMTRAKGTDRVYVYAYNTETRQGLLSAPAERHGGRLQMLLPEGWDGLNIRMWGFVVDGEGRASASAYIELGSMGFDDELEAVEPATLQGEAMEVRQPAAIECRSCNSLIFIYTPH